MEKRNSRRESFKVYVTLASTFTDSSAFCLDFDFAGSLPFLKMFSDFPFFRIIFFMPEAFALASILSGDADSASLPLPTLPILRDRELPARPLSSEDYQQSIEKQVFC